MALAETRHRHFGRQPPHAQNNFAFVFEYTPTGIYLTPTGIYLTSMTGLYLHRSRILLAIVYTHAPKHAYTHAYAHRVVGSDDGGMAVRIDDGGMAATMEAWLYGLHSNVIITRYNIC